MSYLYIFRSQDVFTDQECHDCYMPKSIATYNVKRLKSIYPLPYRNNSSIMLAKSCIEFHRNNEFSNQIKYRRI